MIYHSIQDLLNLAKEYQIPLWEVVCRADMEERQVTKEQSFETMHRMYEAMKQALGLDEHSVVLLLNTEGATDPDDYRRVVGRDPQTVGQ